MIALKRALTFIIALAAFFSFAGCKSKNDETYVPTEPTEASTEKIIPDDVDANSPEAKAVREAAASMLDTFISADFDAIKEVLVEEDEEYFDFESEQQREFYSAILPKAEYEFEFVAEHDGVYGVMTTIYSPDMASVYGSMIMDIMESDENYTEEEFRKKNTETMKRLLNADDGSVPTREEELYIYVEYDNGKYIPRCDMYLANALLGGSAEASDEIRTTLNEAINSLGDE